MNYKLELDVKATESPVVFNTILLDSFKVNIVERYTTGAKPKLCEVLFKVRTLDDKLFKKKDGNINTYMRGEGFVAYQTYKNVLSSPYYRKKLINTKQAEQDFIHFILSSVILNYDLM
jgi:hypothetical protein